MSAPVSTPKCSASNCCSHHNISQALPTLPWEASWAPHFTGWLGWVGLLVVDNDRSRRRTKSTNAFMPRNWSPGGSYNSKWARLCRPQELALGYWMSWCLGWRLGCRLGCRLGWDARGKPARFTPWVCSPADCSANDFGNPSFRAGTIEGRKFWLPCWDLQTPWRWRLLVWLINSKLCVL